jgi:hypothetical protein
MNINLAFRFKFERRKLPGTNWIVRKTKYVNLSKVTISSGHGGAFRSQH